MQHNYALSHRLLAKKSGRPQRVDRLTELNAEDIICIESEIEHANQTTGQGIALKGLCALLIEKRGTEMTTHQMWTILKFHLGYDWGSAYYGYQNRWRVTPKFW